MKLIDIAKILRSKNAGPLFITFDIIFHSSEDMKKVYSSLKKEDIAASYGTPIYAADAGTVTFAGWDRSLGWCVKIDHGNGIISIYGHASSLAEGMYSGKKVYQGETISYVGSTGNSTGNHLHFALYQKSSRTYLDPQKYL